jgi:hypothetical protein
LNFGWFVDLFFGVFLGVFVEFATEAGSAVVAGVFGPSTVGEPVWKVVSAMVALV